MGTDRVEIFHGPCVCGNGEVTITLCTPDHPWPTKSKSFEISNSCGACKEKYALIQQNNWYVFAKRDDLARQKAYWDEYNERGKALLEETAVTELIYELQQVLEAQRSVAACYRVLSEHGLSHGTDGTFRRHWQGSSHWIERNIWPHSLKAVMKTLGTTNEEIDAELAAIDELQERHRAPLSIVGEPLVDLRPYS